MDLKAWRSRLFRTDKAARIPLQALPGATLQLDSAGNVVGQNYAAEAALASVAPGDNLVRLLNEEGAEKLLSALARPDYAGRDYAEFETFIDDRLCRISVGAAADDQGMRYVKIADITDYRSLSEQARQNEERYRSLFFENPDAAFSLSPEGLFLEVNWRCLDLTGYALEELIGQRWDTLVVPADRESVAENLALALEGNPCSYNCRVATKSGREIRVQVTNMPIVVGGQIMGVFGIAKDKTERHRLEEQRRLLHAAMARIQDVILITGTEPLDEPGPKIVFVNQSVEASTGYSPGELIGQTPRIFQGPETDPAACRRIREALEKRLPVKEVLINYRKDGTSFWNELEIVPIAGAGAGGREYFAAVQRDITRRKQSDLALRQSREELRRLNSAQDSIREEERRRIARDLHDELGQTLTAMKLDLGMVMHDLRTLPAHHIERLQAMVDFVDEIIDQVREIAANLRPAMLDDLGFEATAEWFLDQCASRYGLDIAWQPSVDVNAGAAGEVATALFRILQECMTNISRHGKATRVTVKYEEADNRARLAVNDDGVGFDPESTDRSGFGLVGMRERASMLGGTFSLNTAVGEGVSIDVSLPLESDYHD